MPQRLSREFTVDRTVQGQREAGELARNVRARVTYGRPMIDSELTPQLYQTLPVENRELIPGVRAAIPRAVARRSTEDLREKRERAKMYKEDSRSFQQGSIFSAGPADAFFGFDPDRGYTERNYYTAAEREMQAAEEYWRNQIAERVRHDRGEFTDSLRYARVLETGGSQTQRRERRAEAQQQNTVRNMLNLPTRLMLTDGNVMTTVREPPVVIEVD